jgi:hypothetical protein
MLVYADSRNVEAHMKQTKITPSDLQRQAEELIASGKMPTLEALLAAIAETRAEFLPLIAAARRERSRRP